MSDSVPDERELAQCLATLEALHTVHPAKLKELPHAATILAAGYSLARRAGSALRDRAWERPRRADEGPLTVRDAPEEVPDSPQKRRRFHDPEAVSAPTSQELIESERAPDRTLRCYLCDNAYRGTPSSAARHCDACAALCARKRDRVVDLRGRVALVTGARIRIGYTVALSLLRAGAHVHATTRFTAAALERFAREPDFDRWSERLTLHALDLCDLPSTERFAERLSRELPSLDVLINNAARTVDHPPSWLDAMRAIDAHARRALPAPMRAALTAVEGDDPRTSIHPPEDRDEEGQPLDERASNSWRARIGEVSLRELLAVHAVNALAPFVLIDRLRAKMTPGDGRARFIVNVSSPEGRFYRRYKGPWHPHTNMAKAALDMLTRTCAEELSLQSVYMTSVDPGWVSDLHTPVARGAIDAKQDWAPPVSLEDAAMRVLDPVFSALEGASPLWGVALRNFAPCPW